MNPLQYRDGNEPAKGDIIDHAEDVHHPEAEQLWVVTSLCGDMLRAKCFRAPAWRQAFIISGMKLVHRKGQCQAGCGFCQ